MRCSRKLVKSFKKLGCVVRLADDWMTSPTCAKYFGRFDRRTKSNRFKVCQQCHPIINGEALLPNVIVSKLGHRKFQRLKKEEILEQVRRQRQRGGVAVFDNINQPAVWKAYPKQPVVQRLYYKSKYFTK